MKIKLKHSALVIGLMISMNSIAGPMGKPVVNSPWNLIASIGYSNYSHAYNNNLNETSTTIGDGQTGLGRFAIARSLVNPHDISIGAELGLQSGNTMRLGITQSVLDLYGGLPAQVTIKPSVDLLATAVFYPVKNNMMYGIVKAGAVYRHLQVNDRSTLNDLSQIAPEVQAGIGLPITDHVDFALLYQGIYAGNLDFMLDNTTGNAHIANIPTQNSILLSIIYKV